ncbi:ATP-dependent Clp protease ATP-binding subunit [Patescibacteria group bacterium]|nr:ATP-dependent Clp protease ATP-binding subunit [Patescibacteria group bacterium]MBU1705923.1 ATP-dependent Clp protease ATP-binding subunit [Patescibacteria group bacterium]
MQEQPPIKSQAPAPADLKPTLGVSLGKDVFVWSERVDATAIALRNLRDRLNMAVNIVALVAALFFFLLFIYVSLFQTDPATALSLAYWLVPTSAGLYFSIAVLIGCFVFYRLAESARRRLFIPPLKKADPKPQIQTLPPGKQKNIARLFDPTALKAVEEAYQLAARYQHKQVRPLHLFIGSLTAQDVGVVFGRLGLKFDQIKDALGRRLNEQQKGAPTQFAVESEETLLAAFLNAYQQSRKTVTGLEIFYEAYRRDAFVRELLYDLKVDETQLLNVVEWIRITGKLRERFQDFQKAAFFKPTGPMNRAMTSVATPALDAVSDDLTAAAVAGDAPLLIGRQKEMAEILRVIEGGRQSVVLVGADGTGKSAVLQGLAQLMVEERVPEVLQDKRLVSLNIPYLVSGANPAQAQERLLQVLVDVARSRNIILAIPNLEQLTGLSAGSEQTADLSALLIDFLARGSTFAIATTTPQAYVAAIERSILGRSFEKVELLEPDINESIQILESKIGGLEYEHHVIFSYDAVAKAVQLSDRYMHEEYLPQKAINVCREVALEVAQKKGQNALVTGEDVAGIIADKTNIPITQVTQAEKEKLLNLEEKMRERMVGQAEAVSAVADALRRARAELRSENRPIATFLFLGPTGVGKTELAKTVAEVYFGREEAMLRFDMSEYQESGSIDRLIGVPGSNEGGLLTEAVRRHPFSIVLLDELEKAHPDILNVFLQVFDDGRLTDAAGRTIDFTNAIIVATSNAGSQYIQDAVRQNLPLDQIKNHLLEEELRSIYRPEFLNRFDGTIVFKTLSPSEVEQIAYLMINQVAARLEPKGIHFRASDEAVAELARLGYDPKFGARPLRRVVQEKVDNAIAEALLEGRVSRRDTIILEEGGKINIEKAPAL